MIQCPELEPQEVQKLNRTSMRRVTSSYPETCVVEHGGTYVETGQKYPFAGVIKPNQQKYGDKNMCFASLRACQFDHICIHRIYSIIHPKPSSSF